MGILIEDRYEAEFTLKKSAAQVWSSLEQENANSLEPAWLCAFPRISGDVTGEILDKDPPHQVRVRKVSEPCKDTVITITLESVEHGTRVLMVQSGFPAYVQSAVEIFRIGGDQIMADLALFLQRGIEMSRHSMPWAFSGIIVEEVDSGLEVTAIVPDSFGERVGLQADDLLMTLNGAPVFTQHCLQAMFRVFQSGDEVEVQWVRGTELQAGGATL
jgi:hypothetical protein